MTRPTRRSGRGVPHAALLGAVGCVWVVSATSCAKFADPSTVDDLRVLAVRAEPSEVILNLSPGSDISAVVIPEISLSPLIVDPRGNGRPVLLRVSACANDPGAMSPPNNGADPTGFPSGGARTTVGSALCDGAATEVSLGPDVDFAANPTLVARLDPAWVANAFAKDIFLGPDGRVHGGFDLGMPVVFELTAQAGDETVRAIKRVTFWAAPVREGQLPNLTPEISAVSAYDRRDPVTAEPIAGARQAMDEGVPFPVETSDFWIDPAPGVAEPYVTAVLDRLTGQVVPHEVPRETLHYTFFAPAGTFSPFETSSEPPPGVTVSYRVHIESRYQRPAPGTDTADVTIWIVVRDERGGASWVTRTLHLPDTATLEGAHP